MTLDWWGLGLQAINVLILVWLLSRVFWQPVAGAIARRQEAAQAMLDEGQTAREKADAALAEVAKARAGIASERDAILSEAMANADALSKAEMTEAQIRTDALMTAARAAIERDRTTAQKENAAQAAALSVEIAAKLLERFNTAEVQAAFLADLIEAINGLSGADRAALSGAANDIEIVTSTVPRAADKTKIEDAVRGALDGSPTLRFITDPVLIAGLELRSAHFVLRNSWRADLERIQKELENAA